jgi:aminoglycoside phosphotransferase (APT) family kinase protein
MDSSSLLSYLQKSYPNRISLKLKDFKDITSGWETQIFSFDLEWSTKRGKIEEGLIVRVYSPGIGAAKAERESTVMTQLLRVGYPVPRIHLTETNDSILGSPFIIMDRIHGSTLNDKLGPSDVENDKWVMVFSRLFVKLHKLDWKYFVADSQSYHPEDPYYIVKSKVAEAREALTQHKKKDLMPIVDWLHRRIDSVPCKKPSLIHGDFHPMNIMIDDQQNPFVIDWGAAKVSDYRNDLAWTLLLTRAYSTKENRDSFLNGYQRTCGHDIEEIEYFEVFAILRRLFDVSVSLDEGAAELGMREDAVEMMKAQMGHIRVVYDLLVDLTGITISEIETWIDSFTK